MIDCPICGRFWLVYFKAIWPPKSEIQRLWFCCKCSTICNSDFIDGTGEKISYENGYNRVSYRQDFDRLFETMGPSVDARLKFLTGKHLGFEKGQAVLEIGPGIGVNISRLHDLGLSCEVVEPDKEACEYISRKVGCRVHNGYFHADLIKDRKYNLIFAIHVFEHITDPLRFLDGISECLDENGRLVLEVPNGLKPVGDGEHWEEQFDPTHVFYYNKNSLKRVLMLGGFAVEFVSDKSFPPYRNLLMVCKKSEMKDNGFCITWLPSQLLYFKLAWTYYRARFFIFGFIRKWHKVLRELVT